MQIDELELGVSKDRSSQGIHSTCTARWCYKKYKAFNDLLQVDNINNIKDVADTVLIDDSERKLQKLLDKGKREEMTNNRLYENNV